MIKWIEQEKNQMKILGFIFHPCLIGVILALSFEWYQAIALGIFGAALGFWILK